MAHPDVVINEIHYAPRDKTVPEELIELHNTGPAAVDLGGWFFSAGVSYTFPAGTVLEAGGYIALAQDPATLRLSFPGVRAVGPYSGHLSNDGERIVLNDAQGNRIDEVDYRRSFPWPTVVSSTGYSIELVNPGLDNSLGGSWRLSSPSASTPGSTLVASGQSWRLARGTAEPSSPRSAWREVGFVDGTWQLATAPVGYGEAFIATELADMRGAYSTFYLRKTFEVPDLSGIGGLALEALYDDGFNAWINGVHVLNADASADDPPFNAVAASTREVLEFERFELPRPSGYLVQGTNVLCIQLQNISLDTSSDAFFDARLVTSTGSSGSGPTPSAQNSVFSTTAPPQIRQVDHTPESPVGGDPVVVTARVTDPDGVKTVTLEYQVVLPGSYIELTDPAYATSWTSVPMNDAGTDADVLAGDGTYSGLVPASANDHRSLIRYRLRAEDTGGARVTAPYPEDPQPNFAYFVHDGVPGWSGAIEPGSTNATRAQVVDYPPSVLGSLPVYHLISKKQSVEDATWNTKYQGDAYPWRGTLVVDGKVYDHIGFRARGGVWRYAMGKNMWKLDFLTGHPLEARDNFGRKLKTPWKKLNFSACIQQGDYLHRGEQGMFEAAGFKLFELAGVEACRTFWVTFRIIDEADELGLTQYDGDFWGLYLAIEQLDGQFLDEHDLPDGNLYKMEGGTGELNNLGPQGPKDKSDLNEFLSTYSNTTPTDAWWQATFDLDRYYGYRTIVEAIHHGDIGYGKNYFYYLNPETLLWAVYPWDLDLTWADNMFGDGNEPFKSRVLPRPAFSLEYKNRAREIRDLLFNTSEGYKLLDELAAIIDNPLEQRTIVDVDRARWDYNPVMTNGSIVNLSKAGSGRFYQRAATKDFRGMVKIMRDYVVSRSSVIDTSIANDAAIPRKPTITYSGPAGAPVDQLQFTSSAFSDPQGNNTFGAMRWRLAEVDLPGGPAFDPASPRLFEINAAWESPAIDTFEETITFPAHVASVGHLYRARVRHQDATGRWSNWSDPVEITVGSPSAPFPQQLSLRVSEIHFHPAGEADTEFVELLNIGAAPLDLTPVSFTEGIDFSFARGGLRTLAPGGRVVVVQDLAVFRARYGAGLPVAGEFKNRLASSGEILTLTHGGNVTIQSFTYDDAWYPLADGGGSSLEIVDERAPVASWNDPANWRASAEAGGTPGAAGGGGPAAGRRVPGDSNGNARLELGDAVSILWRLFLGGIPTPCDGELASSANLAVLDVNGSGSLNLTDAISVLNYLFLGGAPPALGVQCVRIEGCTDRCDG